MSLTNRQKQVVCLLSQGNTQEQCAASMHRSLATIKRHVVMACQRVNARNTAHLIAKAISGGWIPPIHTFLVALVLTMAAGGADDQLRNTARIRLQRSQQQFRREV